ncbi:MAG: response regulator transcription factor [Nitrospirota bacterium]
MIKILIADDHPVVREGIKKMLENIPDIKVTGEATTAQEVLNKIEKNTYDILLLDISLPDRSGLDILNELREKKPELPVLVLSIHDEEQYVIKALKLGASGYLSKKSAFEELDSAIRRISGGRRYISASLAKKLTFYLIGKDKEEKLPHERLTEREYNILCMIAKGIKPKEIAEELSLSVNTVGTYRNRILEKMDMKTTAELIHYAIKHTLVN